MIDSDVFADLDFLTGAILSVGRGATPGAGGFGLLEFRDSELCVRTSGISGVAEIGSSVLKIGLATRFRSLEHVQAKLLLECKSDPISISSYRLRAQLSRDQIDYSPRSFSVPCRHELRRSRPRHTRRRSRRPPRISNAPCESWRCRAIPQGRVQGEDGQV